MVRFTGGLLLFSAYAAAVPAVTKQQQAIQRPTASRTAQRKLQGRFLHITDVHPDPFYEPYTEPDGNHPCHHKGGKGKAGHFGAEVTGCDTPFTLVNATFDWIGKHIKDDIDFVVWTGDSSRHDNDEKLPRNNKQIADLNRFVVDKFVQVFGKTGEIDSKNPLDSFVIPIVPTFGNNDILPHNIMTAGPNRWTREFEDIWRGFVPQEQKHSFARGGWFFSEVIPNRLAVFSLNTLYFFDSNSAVDGCDAHSEPGYEHMEWLRIQLQFLRDRGMKAILIGHVPPARTESKQNWDETCFQKYTLWLRQYRDVILANIFGHMNIDHFMFQDVSELKYKFDIDGIDADWDRLVEFENHTADPELSTASKTAYLSELHDNWAELPKPPKGASYSVLDEAIDVERKKHKKHKKDMDKFLRSIGGPYGERFSISLVSPSVVPNFFPTLRVMEYNITGLEHDHPASQIMGVPAEIYYGQNGLSGPPTVARQERQELRKRADDGNSDDDHDVELEKKKKKKKKHKKPQKPDFHVPDPPSKTAAPGPAYSPQSLTLLSWRQLYANLTESNNAYEADVKNAASNAQKPYVNFELEYEMQNDKYYKMKDLTMRSWLDLAERIGREELKPHQLSEGEGGLEEPVPDTDRGAKYEEDSDVDTSSDDEVDVEKKKKHRKKKKKGKMKNHLWKQFLHRAYVQTKDDDELDETFG